MINFSFFPNSCRTNNHWGTVHSNSNS
jgi:hypothetical protein